MKHFAKQMLWLVSVLAMTLMVGCSDDGSDGPEPDVIWDIAPLSMYVSVVDAEGNDMLNPDAEGSISGESVTVKYENKTYETIWHGMPLPEIKSRYIPAIFREIYHFVYREDPTKPAPAGNPWVLNIGELPRDENYDVTLPLTLRGRTYELRVVNTFRWKKHQPDIHTTIYIDGEEQPEDLQKIVL